MREDTASALALEDALDEEAVRADAGRSLLSADATPSWSSSVSSESSESESRAGPVVAFFGDMVILFVGWDCFLPAGGGDGDGDGELRESSDRVELAIVVDNDDEQKFLPDNRVCGQSRDGSRVPIGACARITLTRFIFGNHLLSYLIN